MGLHTFPWSQTHAFSWYNINLGGERNRDLREPSEIRVYPKSGSRNEAPSSGAGLLGNPQEDKTHSLMGRAGSVEDQPGGDELAGEFTSTRALGTLSAAGVARASVGMIWLFGLRFSWPLCCQPKQLTLPSLNSLPISQCVPADRFCFLLV